LTAELCRFIEEVLEAAAAPVAAGETCAERVAIFADHASSRLMGSSTDSNPDHDPVVLLSWAPTPALTPDSDDEDR
jgi:hypothetical protein